jgi:hypothetical protein
MLKLGSVHDYPEIFHTQKTDAVLSDDEVAELRKLHDFRERRRWLLRRVVLKDLAMEYLSTHHKRYFPLNTIEIRENEGSPIQEIHCLMLQKEEATLYALSSSDGEMGVGFVMPLAEGLRGGLSIQRVERCYPFMLDKTFSDAEEAYLRGHSDADVDASTMLFLEVKRLCNELFPEMKGMGRFFIDYVDGDEQVFLDKRQLALPGAFNQSWVHSWHWDDYVILLALFYSDGSLAAGFEPSALMDWA